MFLGRPLRLAVYEGASDGMTFEYGEPPTQFSFYQDARIDNVARTLDGRLSAFIEELSI
jgi:hypothetical protein